MFGVGTFGRVGYMSLTNINDYAREVNDLGGVMESCIVADQITGLVFVISEPDFWIFDPATYTYSTDADTQLCMS